MEINTNDFEIICDDILKNKKFKSLKEEMHHGISRHAHCLRVAKATYRILNITNNKEIENVTRAALLHDFYNDNELEKCNAVEKLKKHPDIALANSKKYFDIDSMQEDIIVNHMFPSTKNMPKTKEAWLVSCVDKGVAVYEMAHYKAIMQLGVLLLFVFNLIKIQN